MNRRGVTKYPISIAANASRRHFSVVHQPAAHGSRSCARLKPEWRLVRYRNPASARRDNVRPRREIHFPPAARSAHANDCSLAACCPQVQKTLDRSSRVSQRRQARAQRRTCARSSQASAAIDPWAAGRRRCAAQRLRSSRGSVASAQGDDSSPRRQLSFSWRDFARFSRNSLLAGRDDSSSACMLSYRR